MESFDGTQHTHCSGLRTGVWKLYVLTTDSVIGIIRWGTLVGLTEILAGRGRGVRTSADENDLGAKDQRRQG